jgi:hypothetical protein
MKIVGIGYPGYTLYGFDIYNSISGLDEVQNLVFSSSTKWRDVIDFLATQRLQISRCLKPG